MELAIGLVGGFVLGILGSTIAWVISEYLARPCLDITVDPNRAQGQRPDGAPPHEFYHVRVRNLPARWPVPGRRPAWACMARIEVFREDESRAVEEEIEGRWTSQPEPLLPIAAGDQIGNVLDPARVMQAQIVNVHAHADQAMSVLVKFEGEPECHVFTNESYIFPRWQHPGWRLPQGCYRLRVTVHYESGRTQSDFELCNNGPSRDDLGLALWPEA